MQLPVGVHLEKKSKSALLSFLGKLLSPWTPGFMTEYWTTIFDTIYVPTRHDADEDWGSDAWIERNKSLILHEQKHVEQFSRRGPFVHALVYLGPSALVIPLGLLLLPLVGWIELRHVLEILALGVALLPLSIGFAYGRWVSEREGYQVNRIYGDSVDWIVNTIYFDYLYPWPRSWMRKWFEKNPPKS